MGNINFKKYIIKFEKLVVIAGVQKDLLGSIQFVSVKNTAINSSNFAKQMGRIIPTDLVLALDYYGYYKKSSGFYVKQGTEKSSLNGRQLKMMSSIVVHFNSIKMEDIVLLTGDTYIISNFPEFKQMVLSRRGFKNGS